MLETKYFMFDRKGHLTIFLETVSHSQLVRILRMCTQHARRKKTKKPCQWRFVPTLTDRVVA